MIYRQLKRSLDPIYVQMKAHRFTQGLFQGHLSLLPQDTFNFFIEQDDLYLRDYARALRCIADRLCAQPAFKAYGLKYKHYSQWVYEEQKLHKKYLGSASPQMFFHQSHPQVEKIPVIQHYTQHLLHTAQYAPLAVAMAAVLPCSDFYRRLGQDVNVSTTHAYPLYQRWIKTYTKPEFVATSEDLIDLFNQYVLEDCAWINLMPRIEAAALQSAQYELAFYDSVFDEPLRQSFHPTPCGPTRRVA